MFRLPRVLALHQPLESHLEGEGLQAKGKVCRILARSAAPSTTLGNSLRGADSMLSRI